MTVGDSAFPSRVWLMKAFPDTTGDPAEINFNKKLRSARVVSEHAYGMLKGRWQLLYKKVDCNKKNKEKKNEVRRIRKKVVDWLWSLS